MSITFRIPFAKSRALSHRLSVKRAKLLYPLEYNHGVLFFNMGFWVRFNSKNPSKSGLFEKKVGVYLRKNPKTGLFTLPGAQFKSGLQSSSNKTSF